MAESEAPKEDKTIPFFPDHIITEARVAVVILLIVVAIGIFAIWNPIGLGDPADPMDTPAHTKPEWYFLFLYEILKYIPKNTGALLPFVAVFILILWPFLDRRTDSKRARRTRLILAVILIAGIIGLTLLGELT